MKIQAAQSGIQGARPAELTTPQRTRHGAEQKSLSHNDYTVGWVCALPLELGAATAMLDEEQEILPLGPGDRNTYTLGRVGRHNVVLVCLPSYGTAKAATTGLMVGIGGGAPTSDADIRLGDIVVGDFVVQYDIGKTVGGGKFERTGGSGKSPPDNLKMAVLSLRGRHNLQPSRIPDILSEMLERHPSTLEEYNCPMAASDRLFDAAYDHVEEQNDGNPTSCGRCDISRLVQRSARPEQHCKIHYGKIASGNQVMKHGRTRDRLAQELGAVCFEMEAAGLVDANFPCLVVRGISDYADSHKNKLWQGYAAAVAAAYAKELLAILPAGQDPSRVTSQGHLPDDPCQEVSAMMPLEWR
ncbi:nucleoside phosphorylase domain-containing protein [Fusarium solani]|uniref:Nucleoside phosphorylase domain-containing protein n=1 Tax=Fusarium solani TaxID=169388 RepID=A0A9P9K9E7_FUSSL|nr:nucleoside phosphorylase domain-containing protein [Fusarium solani]KAH7253078.1 nucleoside phosphorylase domain-containing protein [Fusarium solani]